MKRIVYPLIWLAVTVTAVLIASAAVSSVRDQVTDTPTAILPPTTTIAISSMEQLVADPVDPSSAASGSIDESTTSTTTAPTTTTSAPPETSTTVPTTTVPPASDSEAEPIEAATTTTTSVPTTTSTSAPTTEIRSYELIGGSVSVEIGDGTVRLAGASPKPGFTMEVEKSGPEKVEVEFHNDDRESHFSAKFEDGHFEPSISESDEESDD